MITWAYFHWSGKWPRRKMLLYIMVSTITAFLGSSFSIFPVMRSYPGDLCELVKLISLRTSAGVSDNWYGGHNVGWYRKCVFYIKSPSTLFLKLFQNFDYCFFNYVRTDAKIRDTWQAMYHYKQRRRFGCFTQSLFRETLCKCLTSEAASPQCRLPLRPQVPPYRRSVATRLTQWLSRDYSSINGRG